MGLMDRMKRAVGLGPAPAPVEWQGEQIEAALRGGHQDTRVSLAETKRQRNVWAVLRPGHTSGGRPKVDVHALVAVSGRGITGGAKIGQAVVAEGSALDQALRDGVQVGVVQLTADVTDGLGQGVEYSAVLMLGRGYRYRPRAAWD